MMCVFPENVTYAKQFLKAENEYVLVTKLSLLEEMTFTHYPEAESVQ
jgi:hypothetical protein